MRWRRSRPGGFFVGREALWVGTVGLRVEQNFVGLSVVLCALPMVAALGHWRVQDESLMPPIQRKRRCSKNDKDCRSILSRPGEVPAPFAL